MRFSPFLSLLFLLSSFVLSAPGAHGANWTRFRSGDIREIITDVFFLDDGLHGWMVYQHTVARTTDGGETWDEVVLPLGGAEGLSAICFLDANEGWAVTHFAGTILHSIDGGATWEVSYASGIWLEDVFFYDSLHGWAVGDAYILRTVDGGASWDVSPFLGGTFEEVQFVSALHGWVIHGSEIWVSDDGGVTWTTQLSSGGTDFRGLSFADSLRGCAVGHAGPYGSYTSSIYVTADAGSTWNTALTSWPALRDVDLDSTGEGYAVGHCGVLLHTTDGGAFFTEEQSGMENILLSVSVFPGGAWASGNWGTLLREPVPGDPWERVLTVTNNLNDVACGDSLHALIVGGEQGLLLRTEDGGETWEEEWPIACSYQGEDLRTVDMVGSSFAWTGGEMSGGVLRSTDGGVSWNAVPLPMAGLIRAIDFADSLHGWCLVDSGGSANPLRVLHSTDGGLSWAEQPGAASGWTNHLFALDSLHVWLCGGFPGWAYVGRTTDGGETWAIDLVGTEPFSAIVFRDDLEGWAAGTGGTVFQSNDGGASWSAVHHRADTYWSDVTILPGYGVVIAGADTVGPSHGLVERCAFGDTAWIVDLESPDSFIDGVDFATLHQGFAAGTWGEAFHWLLTPTSTPPPASNAALRLEPNRPNPFNPRTTFLYSLPRASPVRLVLYDARGRLIALLSDGPQAAGRHEATWSGKDASGRPVSSGVYFARLRAGDEERTRKIVLLP